MGYFDQFEEYKPSNNTAVASNNDYFSQFEEYSSPIETNGLAQPNVVTTENNVPTQTIPTAVQAPENNGVKNLYNAAKTGAGQFVENTVKHPWDFTKGLANTLLAQPVKEFGTNALNPDTTKSPWLAMGGGVAKGAISLPQNLWNLGANVVNTYNGNPNNTDNKLHYVQDIANAMQGNELYQNLYQKPKEANPTLNELGSFAPAMYGVGQLSKLSSVAKLNKAIQAEKKAMKGKEMAKYMNEAGYKALAKDKLREQAAKVSKVEREVKELGKSAALGGGLNAIGEYDNTSEQMEGMLNGLLGGSLIHGGVKGLKGVAKASAPLAEKASYALIPKEVQDAWKARLDELRKGGKLIERANAKDADLLSEEDIKKVREVDATQGETEALNRAVREGVVFDQGEVIDNAEALENTKKPQKKSTTVKSKEETEEFFKEKPTEEQDKANFVKKLEESKEAWNEQQAQPNELPEYKQTKENTIVDKDDLSPVKSETDINTPNDIKTLQNEPSIRPQNEDMNYDFSNVKGENVKYGIKSGIEHPNAKMDESKVTRLEGGTAEGVAEGNKDLYTLRTKPQRSTNSLDTDNYVTESPQEQAAKEIMYSENGGEVNLKEWNKDLAPEDSWNLNNEIEAAEKTLANKLQNNEKVGKFINAKAKKEFGVDSLLNTAESPALQKALANQNRKFTITQFVKQLCNMPQSRQTARALQVLDMNAPQSIKNIIQAEMKKNNLNYDMSSVKYGQKEAKTKSLNADTPQNRTRESKNHIISKAGYLKQRFADRVQDINHAMTEFLGYINKATDAFNAQDFLSRNKELWDYFTPSERGMLGESNIIFVDELGEKGKASQAIYDVAIKNLEADGMTARTKKGLFETIRHEFRHICDFRLLDKLKKDNPIKSFLRQYDKEYEQANKELKMLEQQITPIFADGLLRNGDAFSEIGRKIVDSDLTFDNLDYYKDIVNNEFGKGTNEARLLNRYLEDWAIYYSHPLEARAFQASKGIKVTGDLIDECRQFLTRYYGTEFTDRYRDVSITSKNAENKSGVRGSEGKVQSILREGEGRSGQETKQQPVDNSNVELESLDESLGDRYDEHGNLKRGSFFSKETPDFTKQDPVGFYESLPKQHREALDKMLGKKMAKLYGEIVDTSKATEELLTNKFKVLNDQRRFQELVNEYASYFFDKRASDLTSQEKAFAKTHVEAMAIAEGAQENIYTKFLNDRTGDDMLHWFGKDKQDTLFGHKTGKVREVIDAKKLYAGMKVRYERLKAMNEMVDFFVEHFGKPLELTKRLGIKNITDYVPVNVDLLKMTIFKRGSRKMFDTLSNGEEAIKKAFKGEDIMNEMLALSNQANSAQIMLPRYILNSMFNNAGESLATRAKRYGAKEAVKASVGAAFDIRNYFFKRRVLGLSPKWFINNRIGNYLMMSKDYDNPLEFAKDWVTAWKVAAKDLPSGVLDTNILDAVETFKGAQKFTDYKPIDDVLNLLSGKKYNVQELKSAKASVEKQIRQIKTKISNKEELVSKLKEIDSAITKANVINKLNFIPRFYNGLIDLGYKFNNLFENHERKMLHLNKAKRAYKEAVDKGEVLRVASNMYKQRQILDWANDNPKVKAKIKEEIFKTLGDYNNLTNVERGFIRRAVPFIKWDKVIIKHCIDYVKNKPEKALILLYELKRLADSNADKQDWQKLSIDLGNGNVFNLSRLIPQNTLSEFADTTSLVGMLNPIVQENATAIKGRKTFKDMEIKNSRYSDDRYYIKDSQRNKWIKQQRLFDSKKQEFRKDKNGDWDNSLPISTRLGYVGTQMANDLIPYMDNNLVSIPEVASALENKYGKNGNGTFMPKQGKLDVGWRRYNDGDAVDKRYTKKKSQRADNRYTTEYDLPTYLMRKALPIQKAVYKNTKKMTPEEREQYYKMIEKAQKAKKGKLYW